MEELILIDYTSSLNQIIDIISNQQSVIEELSNNINIFNFLILSSIAIILGLLLVKD
ncbi:hypothetical protein [Sedimentibacter sp.]|uniref:hypothetical protein n=1 Tax=Sedimentibacter sp. TaxID=1960295 RepID=UPI0028AAD8E8|nr:hypothetical protein [Sedimentibacter sp.]